MTPRRPSYLRFWPLCQVTFLRDPEENHRTIWRCTTNAPLFIVSLAGLCYLTALHYSALLGAFVLGTYLGWASPVMPQFKSTNNSTTTGANELAADEQQDGNVWHLLLDEDQMSWVGSLINVGAVVGCLCGGYLMDKFGRKIILAVVFLLYIVGYLLITLAVDPSEFICNHSSSPSA